MLYFERSIIKNKNLPSSLFLEISNLHQEIVVKLILTTVVLDEGLRYINYRDLKKV